MARVGPGTMEFYNGTVWVTQSLKKYRDYHAMALVPCQTTTTDATSRTATTSDTNMFSTTEMKTTISFTNMFYTTTEMTTTTSTTTEEPKQVEYNYEVFG
jgi:hypothetical protein